MSIRLLSVIWDSGRYESGTLLVLLALADYANDEGECWPHVDSIAAKARLTQRQTHNILRQLKADGVLIVQPGGGRGRSSHYKLNAETLKRVSLNSGSVKLDSVKSATETLKPEAQNTEICSSAIRKNLHEPSIEPLKASARRAPRTFTPPSLKEVTAYCNERRNSVDPQKWIDHYQANGWRVGRNSMKDWRASIRTWERSNFEENGQGRPVSAQVARWENNEAEFERAFGAAASMEPAYDDYPDGLDHEAGEIAWSAAKELLSKRINPHSYETWLRPVKAAGIRDDLLFLTLPTTKFSHLESKYGAVITEVLGGMKVRWLVPREAKSA